MKIIIAPSKTQDIRSISEIAFYEIRFREALLKQMQRQSRITKQLVKTIKNTSIETLNKKMKLSDSLLKEVVYNYKHFNKLQEGNAIISYNGTVFKELKYEEYKVEQFDYIHEHIIILSALYGLLPAFYPIKKYRLDMTMSLFDESLYKIWEMESKKWFEDEELIIDLASSEFSRLVKGNKITVEFVQIVEGKSKIIAYHSKQGRGLVLNYLIQNNITDLNGLKLFAKHQYSFSESLSNDSKIVFSRQI